MHEGQAQVIGGPLTQLGTRVSEGFPQQATTELNLKKTVNGWKDILGIRHSTYTYEKEQSRLEEEQASPSRWD